VRKFGGILLTRSRKDRAGNRAQTPLRNHAPQLPDLWHVRRLPQESQPQAHDVGPERSSPPGASDENGSHGRLRAIANAQIVTKTPHPSHFRNEGLFHLIRKGTGTIKTSRGFHAIAENNSPCISDSKARVVPQPGQYFPVSDQNGHGGRVDTSAVDLAINAARQAAPAITPTTK
jgi:hypothetical protein